MDTKDYWQGLLECETEPFDKDMSYYFIKLSMLEKDPNFNESIFTDLPDDGYTIINNRLKNGNVEVSFALKALLVGLCKSPGECVMWAYTCALIKAKDNLKEVKIENWVNHFPFGIPTDDSMKKAWDSQKVKDDEFARSDNLVDDYSKWPTL